MRENIFSLSSAAVDGDCGPLELSSITSLDISGNYLTLSQTNLSSMSRLRSISLGQQNMTMMGPRDVTMLPRSLVSITVSHMPSLNIIGEGTLTWFTRLEQLTIIDNPGLVSLPANLVTTSLSHQLMVNLSGNSLTWLDSTCLPWSRVSSLDLSDNPLHCDCRMSLWLSRLTLGDTMTRMSGTCASPPHMLGTNISTIDTTDQDTQSCPTSIMSPDQISLISVVLVLASIVLGCVSFACYTLRRNLPRRLGIRDMETKTPWHKVSEAYCHHQRPDTTDNVVSRWTFIQPDQCHISYNQCSGVFTIRYGYEYILNLYLYTIHIKYSLYPCSSNNSSEERSASSLAAMSVTHSHKEPTYNNHPPPVQDTLVKTRFRQEKILSMAELLRKLNIF